MTHSISYHGHQVNYFVEGSGKPIVFLHGWPTHSGLWKAQVEEFKKSHKVITLDWLGFGSSDKPADHHYTFTANKEILDAILSKELGAAEKVTIVVHDIGGPPGILWAGENENRVAGLVLLNTVLYPMKTFTDASSGVMLSLPVIKDLFVSPWGLKKVMKSVTRKRDQAVHQRIDEVLKAYDKVPAPIKRKTLEEPLHHGRSHETPTLSQKFHNMEVPKFLIIAKHDPLLFAHIKKLSDENPDVPAKYIDNCGHFIPVEYPEKLNEIMKGILTTGTLV